MWKKIVFITVIVSALVAGVFWYNYTKDINTTVKNALTAIPTDASIIFESKQISKSWKKISQTNIMWEELTSIKSISKLNNEFRSIDSLLQLNAGVYELLEDNSTFISIHTNQKNNISTLLAFSLPNLTHQAVVEEFFNKTNNGKKLVEHEYLKTHYIESSLGFFAFIKDGICVVSKDEQLLQNSIQQLGNNSSFLSNPYFQKIVNTAGKKVDLNLYVNFKNIAAICKNNTSKQGQFTISSLNSFAYCSAWDIDIKPNALALSGFTQISDSIPNYLSVFKNQKAQKNEAIKFIPSKSRLFLSMGISDFNSYKRDLNNYLNSTKQLNKIKTGISKINSTYSIDIVQAFSGWIGNEMNLVITNSDSEDILADNSYALIKSTNIGNAIAQLNELCDSVNKLENLNRDTLSFRNHTINQLRINNIVQYIFGWQFNKINNCFYTSIDDYVLFANSHEAIISYINEIENNKTFANDKNFNTFSENLSEESNVYLYSSIASSSELVKLFANSTFADAIDEYQPIIKKFEAIGIQFSNSNQSFYSNIYLKYNPEYKKETGTLWETKLDTTLSSKPYLVINHNTKAKEIFVQDDAYKIYLISNTGKILWTKQLSEKIMSDVTQIDCYKNDKLQLVFNTRSAIHMYDRNGNEIKGFPIKLKSPATNSISIVDYERNEDYRIFIATENRRVVCYKANGEQVTAFKFDKTENQVFVPIQYFNMPGKDHICIIDDKGKIYVLNRHGEPRVKIKEKLPAGIRNFFVEIGKDYSKSHIIAADTLGAVSKISLTGKKEAIIFQEFETSPYFDYRDLNNDKIKEYILLTRNSLKVLNQDKSLVFTYEFKNKISQAPQFFTFPDGNSKIGVSSPESNELFLFESNGTLIEGFPINGHTLFSIGDLNNESIYNLITGGDNNSIYVYQLQ
jgi:hypothetical protein